jgi:hypothetical protein
MKQGSLSDKFKSIAKVKERSASPKDKVVVEPIREDKIRRGNPNSTSDNMISLSSGKSFFKEESVKKEQSGDIFSIGMSTENNTIPTKTTEDIFNDNFKENTIPNFDDL